jgi:antagonist of KipI
MSIRVLQPGRLTSVQDLGRDGYQRHGVVVGGAMDPFALRVANVLVGNPEATAVCEMTLAGPTLRFEQDALVAVCGADLTPQIAGQTIGSYRPVAVRRGSVLQFGEPRRGCRAYLAVAGGFDVPLVMGSRSTYLRARLGGFHGRALQVGDVLSLGPLPESARRRVDRWLHAAGSQPLFRPTWSAATDRTPTHGEGIVVRAMRGGQCDWFDAASQELFFSAEFEVTSQSDRMGYRLAGPTLHLVTPRELISEAVSAGTVQVPPAGLPIALMADRPTTGGYPKIATAATVDLSALAQARPGDKIRFEEVSLAAAQQLLRTREAEFAKLKLAVALRENG